MWSIMVRVCSVCSAMVSKKIANIVAVVVDCMILVAGKGSFKLPELPEYV